MREGEDSRRGEKVEHTYKMAEELKEKGQQKRRRRVGGKEGPVNSVQLYPSTTMGEGDGPPGLDTDVTIPEIRL